MAEMTVNLYDDNTLEQVAEQLLTLLKVDINNIEITDIANKLGLKVYAKELSNDISGYIKQEDGINKIFVNSLHSKTRQRFTVAHEIGHFILHRNLIDAECGTILFRGYGDNDLIEKQASRFGAALLMPKNVVEKMYDVYDKNIASIAICFRVSYDAMKTRLKTLGYIND